jgi:hypothetical protein
MPSDTPTPLNFFSGGGGKYRDEKTGINTGQNITEKGKWKKRRQLAFQKHIFFKRIVANNAVCRQK